MKIYKQTPEARKTIAETAKKLPALPLFHNGKIVRIEKTIFVSWYDLNEKQQQPYIDKYEKELESYVDINGHTIYPKGFVKLQDRRYFVRVGEYQKINHTVELNREFRKHGFAGIKAYSDVVIEIHKLLLKQHKENTPQLEKTLMQKIKSIFK
jgi:hypothetical protein